MISDRWRWFMFKINHSTWDARSCCMFLFTYKINHNIYSMCLFINLHNLGAVSFWLRRQRNVLWTSSKACKILATSYVDRASYIMYLGFKWEHPSLVMVVFDCTSETSFNSCIKWLERAKSQKPGSRLPGKKLRISYNYRVHIVTLKWDFLSRCFNL